MSACLAEEDLLALGRGDSGRSLADAPEAEAHVAACAACSALLTAIARDTPAPWDTLAETPPLELASVDPPPARPRPGA